MLMSQWPIVFMLAALVAALLGFGGMVVAVDGIAKVLFFVFLVLFIFTLVMGSFLGRPTGLNP
jgi:uncharacterized membrane protein YtjA (UPF0391 family)